MTLDEARANVGKAVTYFSEGCGEAEHGVIVSVNQVWVMVRYGKNVKATAPGDLTLS